MYIYHNFIKYRSFKNINKRVSKACLLNDLTRGSIRFNIYTTGTFRVLFKSLKARSLVHFCSK